MFSFIRDKISDSNLRKAADNGADEIKKQIENIINERKFKNDLVKRISDSLEEDLKKTIKEIQYVIESRIVDNDYTDNDEENTFFLMPIKEIASISGKGTFVKGRVEQGNISVNDEIEIIGIKPTKKSVVIEIEVSNQSVSTANKGDEVNILLRGICSYDVARGQVLATPECIMAYKKFEAKISMLTAEQGGLSTSFFTGYCPQFLFRDYYHEGKITLIDGIKKVNPGDNVKVICELNNSIVMKKGMNISIYENKKVIAYAKITKILE